MKRPIVSFGVSGFNITLGSWSFNVQGFVPVFLENYHSVSCTGNFWILGGAWFQCRCGGFWVSFCLLMFPGVRVLELSLLPLAFSSSLTVASSLLHP